MSARRLVVAAVVTILLVGAALFAAYDHMSTTSVAIMNATSDRLEAVDLHLPDQQVLVGDLAAGASRTVRFSPRSESGMLLGFRDRSGDHTVEIGYVYRLHGLGDGRFVVVVGVDSASIRELRRGQPDITSRVAVWHGRHW